MLSSDSSPIALIYSRLTLPHPSPSARLCYVILHGTHRGRGKWADPGEGPPLSTCSSQPPGRFRNPLHGRVGGRKGGREGSS